MRWLSLPGALFEWLANPAPTVESAPNEFGRWAAERLQSITCRGYPVRVRRLDVQLAVALQRSLTDRMAMIRELMQS